MALGEREAEADLGPPLDDAPPEHFYSVYVKMPNGTLGYGGYLTKPGVKPEDVVEEFAQQGVTVLWMIEVPLPQIGEPNTNN